MEARKKLDLVLMTLFIGACGLFYECFAAAAGIVFAIFWLLRVRTENEIRIQKNLLLWILTALPALFIITIPYAIDGGMSGIGAVKFLSSAFFVLYIAMLSKEELAMLLKKIPYVGAVLTVAGLAAKLTPLSDWFFINGRFSGFFQYANAYAAFLMICIFLLIFDEFESKKSKSLAALSVGILMAGNIATGCRAVFFLTLAGITVRIIYAFVNRKVKSNWLLIGVIALVIVICLVFAAVSGDVRAFARYTELYLHSSSLMGRLLYNIDGLKMLISHPFGLGYKGFLFYQGAVQTGNYSATYAHNELLQLALDVGVIPAIAAVFGYANVLFRRKTALKNRVILAALGIHALFDWDFQFPVMLMLLAMIISDESEIISIAKKPKSFERLCTVFTSFCIAAALWIGTAQAAELVGNYDRAADIYPWLTTAQMRIIADTNDDAKRYAAAESICDRNEYCTIALQSMAEKKAREGELDAMSSYAEKAMHSSKYNKEGYELYIYMLSYAVENANAAGNTEKTYQYLKDVLKTSACISETRAETSPYAEYLYNKPEIELDDEYMNYLRQAFELVYNSYDENADRENLNEWEERK